MKIIQSQQALLLLFGAAATLPVDGQDSPPVITENCNPCVFDNGQALSDECVASNSIVGDMIENDSGCGGNWDPFCIVEYNDCYNQACGPSLQEIIDSIAETGGPEGRPLNRDQITRNCVGASPTTTATTNVPVTAALPNPSPVTAALPTPSPVTAALLPTQSPPITGSTLASSLSSASPAPSRRTVSSNRPSARGSSSSSGRPSSSGSGKGSGKAGSGKSGSGSGKSGSNKSGSSSPSSASGSSRRSKGGTDNETLVISSEYAFVSSSSTTSYITIKMIVLASSVVVVVLL